MNRTEILKQTFNLLEAEYGEQNEFKKEVWVKVLKGYPAQKIMDACIECIRTGKFFPRVSEMIRFIEGDIESEAEFAWLEFKNKIEYEGSYKSVSFSKYPTIGAVIIAMGGWIEVCNMTLDEEKWVKKEFVKLYKIMKRRGIYPNKLIGRFEFDNLKAGYNEEYLLKKYGMHIDGSKESRKKIKAPESKRKEKSGERKLLKKE